MLIDKVILVTGAASGIGEAAALCFAKAGAKLTLADLNVQGGQQVTERLIEQGHTVHFVETDLTEEAQVCNLMSRIVEKFGRLDGAFNNAGAPPRNLSIEAMDIADWDLVQAINLRSAFLCTKYQMAAMRQSGGGSIVYTASVAGILGGSLMSEYVASKHGVVGLMRSASAEYPLTQVRANAVLPGITMTPMIAGFMNPDGSFDPALDSTLARYSVGRVAQPLDVAQAAKWLLSDEAAMINGVALPVDGGFSARY